MISDSHKWLQIKVIVTNDYKWLAIVTNDYKWLMIVTNGYK